MPAGTFEKMAFTNMTGDIDLFMGNYTVTDKFNAREFRVNIPFRDVSQVSL